MVWPQRFAPGAFYITLLFIAVSVHIVQSEDKECVDKKPQKTCENYKEAGKCEKGHEKYEKTIRRCRKTCGICDAHIDVDNLHEKVYFLKNLGRPHDFISQTDRVTRFIGKKGKWNKKCLSCLKSSETVGSDQMWKFEEDKENNPGYYFISNVKHSAAVNGVSYYESRMMWYHQTYFLHRKPSANLVAAFTGPKADNQLWKVEHYEGDQYMIYPKQQPKYGATRNLMCLDFRHNLNGGIYEHRISIESSTSDQIQGHRVMGKCIWKLVPRFQTSEQWELMPKSYTDNRGISKDSEIQIWLDEGFKLHDETHKAIRVGLEASLETVLGSESSMTTEIENAITQGSTSTWNTRTRLHYYPPAGKQFRIMMKTIRFHSILGESDDYDFRSSRYHMLKPQETKGNQFPPIDGEIYPARR